MRSFYLTLFSALFCLNSFAQDSDYLIEGGESSSNGRLYSSFTLEYDRLFNFQDLIEYRYDQEGNVTKEGWKQNHSYSQDDVLLASEYFDIVDDKYEIFRVDSMDGNVVHRYSYDQSSNGEAILYAYSVHFKDQLDQDSLQIQYEVGNSIDQFNIRGEQRFLYNQDNQLVEESYKKCLDRDADDAKVCLVWGEPVVTTKEYDEYGRLKLDSRSYSKNNDTYLMVEGNDSLRFTNDNKLLVKFTGPKYDDLPKEYHKEEYFYTENDLDSVVTTFYPVDGSEPRITEVFRVYYNDYLIDEVKEFELLSRTNLSNSYLSDMEKDSFGKYAFDSIVSYNVNEGVYTPSLIHRYFYSRVDQVTEVNELEKEQGIYPNPFNEAINLPACKSISIVTMNGEEVFVSINPEQVLDLSYLHSGMYFYTIVKEDNSIQSGKIVKE